MSQENTALVKSLYDAAAVGDFDAALATFSPDIVWHEAENHPYADGNPYIGPKAVAEGVFARLFGNFDGFGLNVENILAAGDLVVTTGRYRGTFKATGRAHNPQFAHVYSVTDGKIASMQQYTDTLQIARVMGVV
jgi:uncharacterized protein